MSLTVQELKDKISMIDKDLDKLRTEGGNSRKLEVLAEYREYVSDELAVLQREIRATNNLQKPK
jgi:hypothetical protein